MRTYQEKQSHDLPRPTLSRVKRSTLRAVAMGLIGVGVLSVGSLWISPASAGNAHTVTCDEAVGLIRNVSLAPWFRRLDSIGVSGRLGDGRFLIRQNFSPTTSRFGLVSANGKVVAISFAKFRTYLPSGSGEVYITRAGSCADVGDAGD
jgi:hypothetical protein